jgi:methionyl-tRNA synthetase
MENEQVKLNIKPEVSYDDVMKIDIRIGKIESVEKVENTDKLYKLTVSFGIETKTIVSAIADKVSSEDLLGKRMPFVINMPPKKLRGIVSEGMIVMAENTDQSLHSIFAIDAEPGAIIF